MIMGALKRKRLGKVVQDATDWTETTWQSSDRSEELQFGARIVVKIKRYMRANNFSQKQLADKLGVTPQRVNKMLHESAADMKIATALRYGKILGIELISIPEEQKQIKGEIILRHCNIDWAASSHTQYHVPQLEAYTSLSPMLHFKSQKQDKYGKRPS